jgi:methionyl aminopeptidase
MFAGRNKIKILTKEEQEGMRKVCRLAREVLDIAAREAKPGVTTDYIDKVVHDACIERNVCCRIILKAETTPLTFSSHTPPL